MIVNRPLGHLKVSSGSLADMTVYTRERLAGQDRFYFMPLNLTKYVLSKKDPKLREAILSADLVLSDGIPVVWFSKRMGYFDVHRVTGIDLAESIMEESRRTGWRMFFLGASPENVCKAAKRMEKRLGVHVAGRRSGFFSENEVGSVIEKINSSGSDILLLGLGMPQKEHFLKDHFHRLNVSFCLPVGGAFDIWAEAKRRSPGLVQKLGIEWLYRSFYDKTRALCIVRYGLVFLKDFLFRKQEGRV